MIRAAIAALVLTAPLPAQAYLLCLGVEPRFSFVSDGITAQFDYVGDATFDLAQALPLPLDPPTVSGVETALYTIPFTLTARDCEVFGVTQDLTIELIVPSNGGQAVFRGCCRDRRQVPAS